MEVSELKYFIPLRQEGVEYTPASGRVLEGEICGSCYWFIATQYDSEHSGPACRIVESFPDDILPTGYCVRWEAKKRVDFEPEPMSMAMAEEGEARAYITPKPLEHTIVDKLLRREKPTLTIYRAADGLRRGLIVTSNSYQDREQEYLSTESLAAYVDGCFTKDNDWQGDNRFMFWHTVDIGDVVAAKLQDTFLVEAVKERDGILAKQLWDYWESHSDLDWAASHGFRVLEKEENTFTKISKFETSILPRSAAANSLTLGRVVPMVKSRDDIFDEAYFPGAAALIAEGRLDKVIAGLQERGVEHKAEGDVDGAATPTAAPETEGVIALLERNQALLVDLIEAQGGLQEDVDGVKGMEAERVKARTAEVNGLNETLTALDTRLKAIEQQVANRPRASQSDETLVTGQAAEDIKAAVIEVNNPFGFSGRKPPKEES